MLRRSNILAFERTADDPPYLFPLPTNRRSMIRSNRRPTIESSSIDAMGALLSTSLADDASSGPSQESDGDSEVVEDDDIDDEEVRNRVRLISRKGTFSCLM